MSDVRGLGDTVVNATSTMLEHLATYLPNFITAIFLILVGWVLARMMRALTMRAAMLIDTMLPRLGLPGNVSRLRTARGSAVAAGMMFWVVLLFFITAATQVLGLQAFTDWLAKLIEYLPTLVAGLLIIAAGWLMSGFAADLVQATAKGLELRQRDVLARIVRISILVGAILVGADQIGIRITFLAIFVGAVAVTVGGGLALAVGLGAREHVANLIAAHQIRQAFIVGQTLRIGEHEGQLLEVTATGVVIETDEGRVLLPARLFTEQPVTVRARANHG
jgi:small-conductance mechanosensitive channel